MAENAKHDKEKEGDKKGGGTPTPESGSKISNTEWGIAIGALLLIDLVQIVLDFVGIGLIANTFIDILVGMAWPTYLHLRGVDLKSVKMFGSILLTFVFETIPVLNALPLWFLDGLVVFSLVKAEKLIKKAAEAAVAAAAVAAAPETGGASLAAEGAVEGGLAASEAGGAAAEGAGAAEEGISDEAAEAMGQESDASGQESESDNPYGDESEEEKSERMAGEEGDGDHEISDEDAENENKKNESQSGENKDNKDKDNKKKKPPGKQGGRNSLFGRSGGGGNPLDLRNRYRSPEEIAEDERLQRHSDLIGGNLLSVVDREGTENRENEERNHSE